MLTILARGNPQWRSFGFEAVIAINSLRTRYGLQPFMIALDDSDSDASLPGAPAISRTAGVVASALQPAASLPSVSRICPMVPYSGATRRASSPRSANRRSASSIATT